MSTAPPGPFDALGPAATIDRFRGWFGGPDDFAVVDAGHERRGDKLALHWLVRMRPTHDPGAARIAEQRAFLTTAQDRITTIDLLCSGWQPAGRAQPRPASSSIQRANRAPSVTIRPGSRKVLASKEIP